jgi:hypothetical protein
MKKDEKKNVTINFQVSQASCYKELSTKIQ